MFNAITVDELIEILKEKHTGNNRSWVFNPDGSLKDEVILLDTINILKELKNADIIIDTDDEDNAELIADMELQFNNNRPIQEYYTYNYNANITDDLWLKSFGDYTCLSIHIGLDARAGFTDFIILDGNIDKVVSTIDEIACQYAFDIDYEGTVYVASNLSPFSDVYDVYDYEHNVDICTSYETEKEDLLEDIKKALEEEN